MLKPTTDTTLRDLADAIRKRFREASVEIDVPAVASGVWYVDVKLGDQAVAVQWQPKHGFGISARPDLVYGERADEVYPDGESAFARIVSLLLSRSVTRPPHLDLGALRREVGVSQVVVAEALSIQQAAVSKLERRHDMLLSTLNAVVIALGARLDIVARFPDGTARLLDILPTE